MNDLIHVLPICVCIWFPKYVYLTWDCWHIIGGWLYEHDILWIVTMSHTGMFFIYVMIWWWDNHHHLLNYLLLIRPTTLLDESWGNKTLYYITKNSCRVMRLETLNNRAKFAYNNYGGFSVLISNHAHTHMYTNTYI